MYGGLNFGLGAIPLLSEAETRSISAENPDGARGGGARAVPDEGSAASMLGVGWKVRPCITLDPGTTTTLADVQGPGVIQHIWITVRPAAYRDTILRFYWDAEETPSIEVPLGDFFCNGHALRHNVNSLPIAVNPSGGFNSYWPMPFRERARITIESQHQEPIGGFFYQITYALTDVPESAAYLHAQWRRSMTTRDRGAGTLRGHVPGMGAALEWLVGRGRDQVLYRWRRRASHDLRHGHGGLFRGCVGVWGRTVLDPVPGIPDVPQGGGRGAQA